MNTNCLFQILLPMHKFLLAFCCLLFSFGSIAQVCIYDDSHTTTGIYPNILPTGYVNSPYDESITFVLPLDTMGMNFTNFRIVSVILPMGLEWQCNNYTNGCNYNPQQNRYGCARITGTPMIPGDYDVTINVLADLTLMSNMPASFTVPITILPAQINTTNDGFSINDLGTCGPQTVTFTNNNPGMAMYAWDFGNGQTSNLENPPALTYDPGTYTVSYLAYDQTQGITVYTLNSVNCTALSGYNDGGLFFDTNPDTFIEIRENGSVIYTSATIDDQQPPVIFSGLNIQLNPSSTYTIQVWDYDPIGNNDNLGTHTLAIQAGNQTLAQNNSTIVLNITSQTYPATPTISSTMDITIHPVFDLGTISHEASTHALTVNAIAAGYQWFKDGAQIDGAVDATYTATESANYSVIAVDENGCIGEANIDVAVCQTIVPYVLYNDGMYSAYGMPSDLTFIWLHNDQVVSGENGPTYTPASNGTIQLIVMDEWGCEYISALLNHNLSTASVENPSFRIYPNPTKQWMHIDSDDVNQIEIIDLTGRTISVMQGQQTKYDLSHLISGTYIIRVQEHGKIFNFKIVKE